VRYICCCCCALYVLRLILLRFTCVVSFTFLHTLCVTLVRVYRCCTFASPIPRCPIAHVVTHVRCVVTLRCRATAAFVQISFVCITLLVDSVAHALYARGRFTHSDYVASPPATVTVTHFVIPCSLYILGYALRYIDRCIAMIPAIRYCTLRTLLCRAFCCRCCCWYRAAVLPCHINCSLPETNFAPVHIVTVLRCCLRCRCCDDLFITYVTMFICYLRCDELFCDVAVVLPCLLFCRYYAR